MVGERIVATIESITASYTIKSIFGSMADVETEAQGLWLTKKLVRKLVYGINRPCWQQGHVNAFKAHLSDGKTVCVQKATGDGDYLEVVTWFGPQSRNTAVLPPRVVNADLCEMVEE